VLLPLSSVAVFTALLTMIGVVVLRAGVLSPSDVVARAAACRLGAAAGGLLLIGLAGSFTAQLLAFNLPPDPLLPDARVLLVQPWGRAWSIEVLLALLGVCGFMVARSAQTASGDAQVAAESVCTLAVAALAFTPAFTGHAWSHEPRVLSVGADGIHVLGAGAWMGTLAALVATASWSREGGAVLLARVRRFSPMALIAAPVVALSGLVSAWLRLTHLSDVWLTTYGRTLSIKVAIFLGVLAMGWFNWRRGTTRLAESGDASAMRASMRAELLMALAVLVATAFLLSTPLPEGS
jgi:putative copper resistance protein D